MRRALAILKYVPAVLCGLLVVAWVVSWFVTVGVGWDHHPENFVGVRYGSIQIWRTTPVDWPLPVSTMQDRIRDNLGQWCWNWEPDKIICNIPVLFAVTSLLPAAVAPFTRFRFPLWSYFVYTAVLAVELAYYLR